MILLVNDDGIAAPGFRALYLALRRITGRPVLAVAPMIERSGMSHAITVSRDLEATPVSEAGFFGFAIDGTPTDCVKLALDQLCQQPPDLVVSGINRGPNVGRSVFYSGTVGAAMEAAVLGLPAMAISRQVEALTVEDGAAFAGEWAARLLDQRDLHGTVTNLNLPAASAARWGEAIFRPHGHGGFREAYRPVRDADGDSVRWRLHGDWVPSGSDDDAAALTASHPVFSLLRPDFNASERHLRRLQALGNKRGRTTEVSRGR